MKAVKLLLTILFSTLGLLAAPASTQAQSTDEIPNLGTVEVGAYIVDVYEIDFPKNQVNVDFYVWFLHSDQISINPEEIFRIINAKEVNIVSKYTRSFEDLVYHRLFIKAVIKKNWTVADYPFDEHTIRIFIEADESYGKYTYVYDTKNSGIQPNLRIPGWEVQPLKLETAPRKWETTFGDPELPDLSGSTIDRILISFMITRPGGGAGLFFKIFSAVLVSVAISLLSMLVSPEELEIRVSLSVGSLFAAVGSQYIISGLLPESSVPTLVDYVHNIAYALIAIAALESIVTHRLYRSNPQAARALNRAAAIVLPILFLVAIVVLWLTFFGAGLFTPPTV